VEALKGGAVVHARYGWDAPKWTRGTPKPPYVAQSLDDPPSFAPLREIVAPTVVLSYEQPQPSPSAPRADSGAASAPAPKPAAPAASPASGPGGAAKPTAPSSSAAGKGTGKEQAAKPPPPPPTEQGALAMSDANAPRLEVTQPAYLEVADPNAATLTVTATNVGHRSMMVAVRPRMVSFLVDGPRKATECVAAPPTHAIPRDNYRSLGPKEKITMPIILHEICPPEAFDRPGLYRVLVTLDAGESGEEAKVHAYTAYVPARAPTLIRLHDAPEAFYPASPKPVPTPNSGGE